MDTTLLADNQSAVSPIVDSATGFENITAGIGADVIVASSAANIIIAGDGIDYINGGAGNDTITGGVGADYIITGAGNDTIIYTTAAHSNGVTAAVLDTITDLVFNGADGDLLDFTLTGALTVATSASGAADFGAADTTAELEGLFKTGGTAATKFTGGANATALLATNTDGSKMLVVDVNGDGAFTVADVAILITGVTVTSFTTAVFV
jgi:Ca2+-binding RTX toxin-like protein